MSTIHIYIIYIYIYYNCVYIKHTADAGVGARIHFAKNPRRAAWAARPRRAGITAGHGRRRKPSTTRRADWAVPRDEWSRTFSFEQFFSVEILRKFSTLYLFSKIIQYGIVLQQLVTRKVCLYLCVCIRNINKKQHYAFKKAVRLVRISMV